MSRSLPSNPAVAALIGVLLVAACQGNRPLPTAEPLPPGSLRVSDAAVLVGSIVEDAATGCVYIRSGGELNWAVWPRGFRVERFPLRIFDGNGTLVAREGQWLYFGGGLVPAPEDECRVGPERWGVADVQVEKPGPAP